MASDLKELQAICRFFNAINLQSILVTYVSKLGASTIITLFRTTSLKG